MRATDPRPARLYNVGGNTCLAIPRDHCRALGLTPRCIVNVTLEDGQLIITKYTGDHADARTPIRKSGTGETA